MLSRTADHLYWMSRYLERAVNLARMIDAHQRLRAAAAPAGCGAAGLAGDAGLARGSTTPTASGTAPSRRAARSTSWPSTASNPGSILQCLRAARENARAVRGTITSDMWETLNATYLESLGFGATMPEARPRRVPRVGQVPHASDARHHLRNTAARRGAALHPHRHLPRARRQHHPHAGSALARPGRPRRAADRGGLGVGGAAARDVGLRDVSAAVPRQRHPAPGHRDAADAR